MKQRNQMGRKTIVSKLAKRDTRPHKGRSVGPTDTHATLLAQLAAQLNPVVETYPPLPACGGVDVWITPPQACRILGIKGAGIYRLIDPTRPFLVFKRPLPRKILVSLRSVTAFSEATKDADFWKSEALQARLRCKLKAIAENKA